MFRFKRSIPVGYNKQGYIYFASRRYKRMSKAEKKKLEEVCFEAGGEYDQALKEFVTTDIGAAAVCQKYHISESTLERIVRRYYCIYDKRTG